MKAASFNPILSGKGPRCSADNYEVHEAFVRLGLGQKMRGRRRPSNYRMPRIPGHFLEGAVSVPQKSGSLELRYPDIIVKTLTEPQIFLFDVT